MYILWLIKKFKDTKDANKTKVTWNRYWSVNWDDFAWILVIGQGLTVVQESLYGLYVSWSEDVNNWDFYIDNEEAISLLVGLFGVLIFNKILKLGTKELK